MEQRALAFDHVPVVGRGVAATASRPRRRRSRRPPHPSACRRRRSGCRSGRWRGNRHPRPRALKPAQRQRGVLLAQRAIGADGEQPLAAALACRSPTVRPCGGGARRSAARRSAARGLAQAGTIRQSRMHAADDVQPGLHRRDQRGTQPAGMTPPAVATPITSDRAPAARPPRPGQLRQPRSTVPPGSANSPMQRSARPVAQAEGGLGVAGFGRVAEEQQIGLAQRHRAEGLARGLLAFSSPSLAAALHWCSPWLLFDPRAGLFGIRDIPAHIAATRIGRNPDIPLWKHRSSCFRQSLLQGLPLHWAGVTR